MDWKTEISKLAYVKSEIEKLDIDHIWPYHLPSVAANKESIRRAEQYLGFQLDQRYADFLRHADGWKGFYQTADLFGTDDLRGSEKMRLAQEKLASMDDVVFEVSGFRRDQILPIASTIFDRDVFVISRPDTSQPGIVIWYAGSEVERFANFDEFFLAMVDYNRAELTDLQRERSVPR